MTSWAAVPAYVALGIVYVVALVVLASLVGKRLRRVRERQEALWPDPDAPVSISELTGARPFDWSEDFDWLEAERAFEETA